MSEQAQTLAAELEAVNAEVIAFAESCPDAVWTMPCVDDGRTVAAVVRHVGGAYIVHARLVQAAASGEPIPAMFGDWEVIHQGNAVSAQKYANADRGETIASLQRNGANLAADDPRPDRRAIGPHRCRADLRRSIATTAQIIALPVVGHPRGHLVGLRATAEGQPERGNPRYALVVVGFPAYLPAPRGQALCLLPPGIFARTLDLMRLRPPA